MRTSSVLLGLGLCLLSLSAQAQWVKEYRGIMGTNIEVDLWDNDILHAKGCIDEVMAEMRHINQEMSPTIKTSELYKVNKYAAERPVKISKELYNLIKRSFYFSRISHGAFDITYASVGYLYNYRKDIKPTNAQIKARLKDISYRHIKLNPKNHTIRFTMKGVRIDLGGIAKGYAVDRSIALLQRCGIKDAMVTAGGDSRIIGDHHGRQWMIGIENPRDKSKSIVAIPLSNTAISTSGDYERYFIKNGIRYHHILNPRTGKSVHSTHSVTIIGPNATTTDALSTTVFVMGPKAGLALAQRLKGIDAVIVDRFGKVHYTSGLMSPSK